MSFQPVVSGSGIAGWRFLQRTYDVQVTAYVASPRLARETDYFLENVGKVQSASELVSDRRLLSVALGAFGLQDDINNRYFIQKILEDGTTSEDSLANKLADDRYRRFSSFFGFGPGETQKVSDAQEMSSLVEKFRTQSFEMSIGERDDKMRVALFAQRELENLANENRSEASKWYSVMGLPPLRSLFETALGLPSAFGQLDIDKQLEVFRDRIGRVTGESTVGQFSNPEARERLTDLFLAKAQISEIKSANSPQANALLLLQSVRF
jgi:hypothetical protein